MVSRVFRFSDFECQLNWRLTFLTGKCPEEGYYIVFVQALKCKFSEQPRQRLLREVRFAADLNGSGPQEWGQAPFTSKPDRASGENAKSSTIHCRHLLKLFKIHRYVTYPPLYLKRYLHPISTGIVSPPFTPFGF